MKNHLPAIKKAFNQHGIKGLNNFCLEWMFNTLDTYMVEEAKAHDGNTRFGKLTMHGHTKEVLPTSEPSTEGAVPAGESKPVRRRKRKVAAKNL